jgi:hypothetical protein
VNEQNAEVARIVYTATTHRDSTPAAPDELARPRQPITDAGLRLARQSLGVAVTIDQILDIEDEAFAAALSPERA